jgi:hypothetical protein
MFVFQHDEIDVMKDDFYEELERVFDKFPKYHMKLLLGVFNPKIGREDILKQKIGNESLDEISNHNGVRVVNFAISKNLSKVQSSNIIRFTNLLGHLLKERLTIKLTIF